MARTAMTVDRRAMARQGTAKRVGRQQRSRRTQVRGSASALGPGGWGRLTAISVTVLVINVLGWGIFILVVLPQHFHYGKLGVGLGVGFTAWTLGARHAFDADHISAIDNVTRKLLSEGKQPIGTGFFFALGHSAVVSGVGLGISIAAKTVFRAVADPSSPYESLGGTLGTLASAGFLYLIAALNVVVLIGITRIFRQIRAGKGDQEELERHLQARGFMWRLLGRLIRSISRPGQMFFVGLAFGIGFDTATEALLLGATAYAATSGLPLFAVMALPLMFSGGMTLFDTLDGCFMNFAYAWAFDKPVRKVYYNLVITGLSIAAAFLIGTVEILGVLTSKMHLHGAVWDFLAGFSVNRAGLAIAILFAVTWAAAIVIWHVGGLGRQADAGRLAPISARGSIPGTTRPS